MESLSHENWANRRTQSQELPFSSFFSPPNIVGAFYSMSLSFFYWAGYIFLMFGFQDILLADQKQGCSQDLRNIEVTSPLAEVYL